MPRKTKDQKELKIEEEKVSKKTAKNETPVEKKASAKATKKETHATKKTSTNNKEITTKLAKTIKEAVAKKIKSKKGESKTSVAKTTKKTTAKKTATKTANSKITSTKEVASKVTKTPVQKRTTKKVEILEYYDLPYRYNQTVVKVLAQTPNNLFIYWDISDEDRENFKKQYGENFFETTKPILIVHNDTLNYHFEIEINDFANSWYLHVNDAKCNYRIELGRKPYVKNEKITADYIHISTSNGIESPNDRILFDKNQKIVYFKNVKTGKISKKTINTISFMKNMGKIYNIYDLYKEMYKDEDIDKIVSNPSSGNPSSSHLSSKFM